MRKKPVILPLTHALAWIVASTLPVSGGGYALLQHLMKTKAREAVDPSFSIRSMIQTGPQKQALKTEYLAELLGLSSDQPVSAKTFNLASAEARLLHSPLISQGSVKLIPPSTLYVDYTVRQPIAWLEDYENVVVDREGYPFPFSPFFSPKNLPSLYLGLEAFGVPSTDPDRPQAQWGKPVSGKYFSLALNLLTLVTDPKVEGQFCVKRIDVSKAYAESYGTREIVLMTEDFLVQRASSKEIEFCLPRILRLSTQNYPQELGRYLKLRQQLLEEERKALSLVEEPGAGGRRNDRIIDFRIPKLAFIEEKY